MADREGVPKFDIMISKKEVDGIDWGTRERAL